MCGTSSQSLTQLRRVHRDTDDCSQWRWTMSFGQVTPPVDPWALLSSTHD